MSIAFARTGPVCVCVCVWMSFIVGSGIGSVSKCCFCCGFFFKFWVARLLFCCVCSPAERAGCCVRFIDRVPPTADNEPHHRHPSCHLLDVCVDSV